jgi:hypothetical protein
MSGAAVFVEDRLVAIVAEHHPTEGMAYLSARPISAAYSKLQPDELKKLSQLIGLPERIEEFFDVVPVPDVPRGLERALAVARELAPPDLVGRDDELAMLTRFCAGTESYFRVQGAAWAGKTAVLARFAIQPPAGVMVASCFVRQTDPQRSDSRYFLHTMNEQLTAISDVPAERDADQAAEFLRLLSSAAGACVRRQQRLILVIDGLDEDASAQRSLPQIGALLPVHPPTGAALIVASRHTPGVPNAFLPQLALRSSGTLNLAGFAGDVDFQQLARTELDAQARERESREILRYITAAGAGLTAADLAALAELDRLDVERIVRQGLGRTVRCALSDRSGSGYEFVHETLLAAARELFREDLKEYHRRLDVWAASWATKGWPDDTPGYLTGSYSRVLEDRREATVLSRLAVDSRRQDLLYIRTASDTTALAEIQSAHRLWCKRDEIDFVAVAALTASREVLRAQYTEVPASLPHAWARLGEIDRAERMARLLRYPSEKAKALVAVAAAVAADDANRAEEIARSIDDIVFQADALAQIAAAIVLKDHERSGKLAEDSANLAATLEPQRRAAALGAIARAIVRTFPERAEKLARESLSLRLRRDPLLESSRHDITYNQVADAIGALAIIDVASAEKVARSLKGTDQAKAFGAIARALAVEDPDRALQLADESYQIFYFGALTDALSALAVIDVDRAEGFARSMREVAPDGEEAISTVASVVATRDPDRAEAITRFLREPVPRARVLAKIVPAIATKDRDRACRLTNEAERLLRSTKTPVEYGEALGEALRVVASTDPDQAVAITTPMQDSSQKARALFAVAATIVDTEPTGARRLAEEAKRLATENRDTWVESRANAVLAIAIANSDPDRAEVLARAINDDTVRSQAIVRVAAVVAATDRGRAERIARATDDDFVQSVALAEVVARGVSSDPHWAEQLARLINDSAIKAEALAGVAAVIGATQEHWARRLAEEAERLARSVEHLPSQVSVLTRLATIIEPLDPAQARRLVESSERQARSLKFESEESLERLARAIAKTDPSHAETISRSIEDVEHKSRILAAVAKALVPVDPVRAAHLVCEGLQTSEWISFLKPLGALEPNAVVQLAKALAV